MCSDCSFKLLFFDRVVAPLEIQTIFEADIRGLEVVHTARALMASSGLVTFDEIWARGKEFEKLTQENLLNHKRKASIFFLPNRTRSLYRSM